MGIRCNAGPLETFALFWYLFVSVVESHYESLTLLPHMGCVVDNFGNISRARPPLPSFQFNLLHQKLSLLNCCIEEKLNKIATKVYRADGVVLAGDAKKQAAQLTELGFDKMPICMAKTQFSFSDDQTKLGAPRGFKITVREIKVNAGAGFLVAKTGNIMTMPGLPKVPASERIDIDANGKITGLF